MQLFREVPTTIAATIGGSGRDLSRTSGLGTSAADGARSGRAPDRAPARAVRTAGERREELSRSFSWRCGAVVGKALLADLGPEAAVPWHPQRTTAPPLFLVLDPMLIE